MSMAQTFKYIGPEDGLSNRRVYRVQKDQKGFIWFLTREGIDRYDGKKFKNYKLQDGFDEINPIYSQSWMYTDKAGNLYVMGQEGRIFKYDNTFDIFKIVYRIPNIITDENISPQINYSFINSDNTIWLFTNDLVYIWNINTKQSSIITNGINSRTNFITQGDDTHYFLGSDNSLHYTELKNDSLKSILSGPLMIGDQNIPIKTLYFDSNNNKLLIGTPGYGIAIIKNLDDLNKKESFKLEGTSINTFVKYKDDKLLISTDGNGIYLIDLNTEEITPFIVADYDSETGMNGNTIKDIYIDEEERIWMANFPIGVTIYEKSFSTYKWFKHSIGNKQSIVNNKVNAIINDSNNDIWFATSNGISLYKTEEDYWHSYYSSYDNHNNTCKQFLSICEVKPGIFWATGYDSEIHTINKKTNKTEILELNNSKESKIKPDSYIRVIFKDCNNDIWIGGEHNFKKINLETNEITQYDIQRTICIIEKDHDHLWIGTMNGLFILNKNSKELTPINLPTESNYIYSLLQDDQGQLYIGTSGSGLIIFNPETKEFTHYHSKNTSLISDNISTILSNDDYSIIIIGTENGLTRFYPTEKRFRNWTKDQGLMSIYYNSSSGIYLGNNYYIFGSIDGAIHFQSSAENPKYYKNKMILSDFRLFYETVYPGEKSSPLINNIATLHTIQCTGTWCYD